MKNKEKYDLRDISYALDVNNCKYDFIIYHKSVEIYREDFDIFSPAGNVFTKWLEEEYKPQILTDKEKAYLSALIKPFRNNVKFIRKMRSIAKEFILIELKCNVFSLPFFEAETMYKGMEVNKKYTLEELGL